jgi:hypothetical protein
MHSYYHLVPLVLSYCSVGYLSDSVGHSHYSWLKWVTDVGVIPRISSADEEKLGFTRGRGVCVLSAVKLHALHVSVVPVGVTVLLGLCNPPRQGCGEPAKPGLLYPVVWIP